MCIRDRCDPATVADEFLLVKASYAAMTGREQKKENNVLCYQIRQSFYPGEITPKEANRIGYEPVSYTHLTTAQQTLPYREMYRDGVCRVADRYYTKTIEYEDINYQLAQSEDQARSEERRVGKECRL